MPGRAEGDTLSGCQWGQVSMELGLLQAGKAARRGSSFQILLQTRCAHEAPAPLGFFSHTHLIMIAGLGNKVLFNSKSIWQPVRHKVLAASPSGCHADPVHWQHRVLKPLHSTPHLGTQLSHMSSRATGASGAPMPRQETKDRRFFPLVSRSGFLRLVWHLPSLGCLVTP